MSEPQQPNRRDVLKKAIYVAPAILSFPVAPAAARSGSERDHHDYSNKLKKFLEKLREHFDNDKHDYDDKKWKGKAGGGWRD